MASFHPDRAAQAIWPTMIPSVNGIGVRFPSRTGSPGHLAGIFGMPTILVSSSFHPERAAQAIPTPLFLHPTRVAAAVSIPHGLLRPFSQRWRQASHHLCQVSIPSGLLRPVSREEDVYLAHYIMKFPSRPGCPGQVASRLLFL